MDKETTKRLMEDFTRCTTRKFHPMHIVDLVYRLFEFTPKSNKFFIEWCPVLDKGKLHGLVPVDELTKTTDDYFFVDMKNIGLMMVQNKEYYEHVVLFKKFKEESKSLSDYIRSAVIYYLQFPVADSKVNEDITIVEAMMEDTFIQYEDPDYVYKFRDLIEYRNSWDELKRARFVEYESKFIQILKEESKVRNEQFYRKYFENSNRE